MTGYTGFTLTMCALLGLGLLIGVGMAVAIRRRHTDWRARYWQLGLELLAGVPTFGVIFGWMEQWNTTALLSIGLCLSPLLAIGVLFLVLAKWQRKRVAWRGQRATRPSAPALPDARSTSVPLAPLLPRKVIVQVPPREAVPAGRYYNEETGDEHLL